MICMGKNNTYFHDLINNSDSCKSRFKGLLKMVNTSLLNPSILAEYNALVKTL